jgi:hypothetical protein
MKMRDASPRAASRPAVPAPPRGRLFRKYVGLLVAVVCAALVTNGLLDISFSFHEQNCSADANSAGASQVCGVENRPLYQGN